MVYDGKPCRRCNEPMVMHSKYQTICNGCRRVSGVGRKVKLREHNEKRKRE